MSDNGIRAINTLIENAIQNLEYTSTEIGTVVGVELAQNGIYTVRVNGTNYRAYSALHDLQLENQVIIVNQPDDTSIIKIILCKVNDDEENDIKIDNISFLTDQIKTVVNETYSFRNYLQQQANQNQEENSIQQYSNKKLSLTSFIGNIKSFFQSYYGTIETQILQLALNIDDIDVTDLDMFLKYNTPLEIDSSFKYSYNIVEESSININNDSDCLIIPTLAIGNSIVLNFSSNYLFDFLSDFNNLQIIPSYYICLKFYHQENQEDIEIKNYDIPLLENSIGNILDSNDLPIYFNKQLIIPKDILFNENNSLHATKIEITFKLKIQQPETLIENFYQMIDNDPDYIDAIDNNNANKVKAVILSYLNFPSVCWWPISFEFQVGVLSNLPNLLLIPTNSNNNILKALQSSYQEILSETINSIEFSFCFFEKNKFFDKQQFKLEYKLTEDIKAESNKLYFEFDTNLKRYSPIFNIASNSNPKAQELYEQGDGIEELSFFLSLDGKDFIEIKNNNDKINGFKYIEIKKISQSDSYNIEYYKIYGGILNLNLTKYESYSFYAQYIVDGIVYKSNILTYMTQEEADTQTAAALGYTINISLANHNIFTTYNSIDPSIYENQQHIGQIGLYHAGTAVKRNEIQSITWQVPGIASQKSGYLTEYMSQIWLFETEEERETMTSPRFELPNSNPSIGFQIFDRFVFNKTKINCEVTLNNGQVLKLRTYLKLDYVQPVFNGRYTPSAVLADHKYPILFYKLDKALSSADPNYAAASYFDGTIIGNSLTYTVKLLDKETGNTLELGEDQTYTDNSNTSYSPIGTISSSIDYIFLSGSQSVPYPDPVEIENYKYFIQAYNRTNAVADSETINSNSKFFKDFTITSMENNDEDNISNNNIHDTLISYFSYSTGGNNHNNRWGGRFLVLEIPTVLGWKYNLPKEYIIANEVERISGDDYFYQDRDQYIGIYKQVIVANETNFNSKTYSYNDQNYSNTDKTFYIKNSNNKYVEATSYSNTATYYIEDSSILDSIPLILSYCYKDSEIYQRTTDQVYNANKKYYKFVNTNATGANHYIFDPDTGLYSISSNGTFIRQQYREAEEFISNNLYEQIKVFRRIDKENLIKTPAYKAEKVNKFIQALGAYDQNQIYYIQKYSRDNYVKLNDVSDTDFNTPSDNTSPLIIYTEVSWKYSSGRNYYQKDDTLYSIIKYADNSTTMPSDFNNPTANQFILENNKLYYTPNANTKILCYQTQSCYTMNIKYIKETTFSNNREYYTKNNGVYTLVKNPVSSDVNNYYYQENDYYQRLGNYYILSSDREFKNDTDYYIISSTDANSERFYTYIHPSSYSSSTTYYQYLNGSYTEVSAGTVNNSNYLTYYIKVTKILYKEVDQDQPEEAYSATEMFYPILANMVHDELNVLNECVSTDPTTAVALTRRDFDFTKQIAKYGGFYKRFATDIWGNNYPPTDLILIADNINKPGPNDTNYQNKSITNYLTQMNKSENNNQNNSTNQSLRSGAKAATRSVQEEATSEEATSNDWLTAEQYGAIGANRLIAASSLPLANVSNQLNFFREYLEYLNKLVDIKEQQLEDSLFIPRYKEVEPKLSGGKNVYDSPFWRQSPFQGPYYLANCTCYAWGRYAEVAARGNLNRLKEGLTAASKLPTGNAGTWYSRARDSGSCITRTRHDFDNATNKKEYLGAVMSWSGGTAGYGHVAVIEKIEEINHHIVITVSESWYRDHGTTTYMRGPTKIYQDDNYRYGSMRLNGFILQ